jgi:hypothetical protein
VCVRARVRIYARSNVSVNMQQAEPMDQRQGHMHQKDTLTPYTIHRTHHTYRDTLGEMQRAKNTYTQKKIHDTYKEELLMLDEAALIHI